MQKVYGFKTRDICSYIYSLKLSSLPTRVRPGIDADQAEEVMLFEDVHALHADCRGYNVGLSNELADPTSAMTVTSTKKGLNVRRAMIHHPPPSPKTTSLVCI